MQKPSNGHGLAEQHVIVFSACKSLLLCPDILIADGPINVLRNPSFCRVQKQSRRFLVKGKKGRKKKKDESARETVRRADKRSPSAFVLLHFVLGRKRTTVPRKGGKNGRVGDKSGYIQRGFSASTLTVSRITVHVIRSGKAGGLFCARCKMPLKDLAILVGFGRRYGTVRSRTTGL